LNELYSVGITSYSLSFDDAAGADTQPQQTAQVALVGRLQTDFPQMKLFTFVPSAYHGDLYSDKSAWEAALATLDTMNASVPMTFTGLSITPSSMSPSQLPSLGSGRRTLFWDNWIAVDSSSRIPWGLIRNRDSALWTSSSYGYILNLAFPLERVIHQLNCLKQLISDQAPTCNASIAAAAWQDWLSSHGFVHSGRNPSEIKLALQTAIEQDRAFASIAELETSFPALSTIFSTPPIVSAAPKVAPSPPSQPPSAQLSAPLPSSFGSSSNSIVSLAFFAIVLLCMVSFLLL
jgi:hypothetical protein